MLQSLLSVGSLTPERFDDLIQFYGQPAGGSGAHLSLLISEPTCCTINGMMITTKCDCYGYV